MSDSAASAATTGGVTTSTTTTNNSGKTRTVSVYTSNNESISSKKVSIGSDTKDSKDGDKHVVSTSSTSASATATASNSAPHQSKPKALAHMSYGCEGVTGKGSQMTIYPCSFQKLFQKLATDGIEYILVPLLQRTYCWSDQQIQAWWRDANGKSPHANADLGDKHGTGKCIFKLADSDIRLQLPVNSVSTSSSSDIGKCLLCIDGQQRITTQSLLYTAVRDCLLKLLFELQRDLMITTHAMEQAAPELACALRQTEDRIKSIIVPLRQLVEELERLLFSGKHVAAMLVYVESCVAKVVSSYANTVTVPGGDTESHSAVAELINPLGLVDGQVLPFAGCSTLLPSYVDRAPFFELLLMGRFNYAVAIAKLRVAVTEAAQATSSGGDVDGLACLCDKLQKQSIMNIDIADFTTKGLQFSDDTVQRRAKEYFDKQLDVTVGKQTSSRKLVNTETNGNDNNTSNGVASSNSTSGSGSGSIAGEVEVIWGKVCRVRKMLPSMNKMSLMYCEILSEVDLAQTFMYLQQQSLFSMGALLQNPTPGIKFAAADWVRNLCLSCVMHQSNEVQEQWYQERWLKPLVLTPTTKHNLDMLVRDFLLSQGFSVDLELESPKRRFAPSFLTGIGNNANDMKEEEENEVQENEVQEQNSTSVVGNIVSTVTDLLTNRPPLFNKPLPATSKVHVSAMEESMLGMLKMHINNSAIPKPPPAVSLYAKFVSYMETIELNRLQKEGIEIPTLSKGESLRIDEVTCDLVLSKLAHFSSCYTSR